jgi:hypothetical protein
VGREWSTHGRESECTQDFGEQTGKKPLGRPRRGEELKAKVKVKLSPCYVNQASRHEDVSGVEM